MTRYAFVLGNGPSLKGFDFRRLEGFDSLGMNAAYRFWDKIGWYPTYYCCLDDQLIETHHEEIDRLYEHSRVREIFVHGKFFEHHPDRVGNPSFYSLDQVLPHWFRKRGQALGFQPLFEHPAFKTSDTTKITTGAFAVRFMAYKGYPKIALAGIDLKYVEVLPEAKPTEGVGLVMAETPNSNPNYFFEGYQQKGDRYNIPNPSVHNGDLHPRSFELVRDDFKTNGVECEVANTNPQSILNERNIFPLVSRDEALEIPALGSVFVPTNQSEVDAIVGNFSIWARKEYSPLSSPRATKTPRLVFGFNRHPGKEAIDRIEKAYADAKMGHFFSGIEFHAFDLEGEKDLYQRDYSAPIGKEGYKAGPNNQFLLVMRAAQPYGRYTFLMETDCVPTRSNWLGVLMEAAETSEPFFVMGSAYRGNEKLDPGFARHINGNAVYATGDPLFQTFLKDHWEPSLRSMIENSDRRLAYDCILEMSFEGGTNALWRDNAHRFRYTNYIQNRSAKSDLAIPGFEAWMQIREAHTGTYLLHNSAAASAVRSMIVARDNAPHDAI